MPNYGYHLGRAHGAAFRRLYSASLPIIARRPVHSPRDLPLDVFSYSSEHDLPEQVASIRSFLRFAGRPLCFTVVSDGTHSARSIAVLQSISPVVRVTQVQDYAAHNLPASARDYLANHPTGKQLALIMALPEKGPALYVDSDVLFFPGARELAFIERTDSAPPRYLSDCRLSADERLFQNEVEKENPVNTGVLLLFHRLQWSDAFARFVSLTGPPNFFTNQTLTHLTMHASGALPLDSAKYVLQLDDQFVYPDRHAASEIVLRHYVRPVRHKFWTTLANSKWAR